MTGEDRMRRLNWTDTPVERARSGGHGSASGSRVVTVRTLIVAAIVLMLLLPLGKVEAREARTVPSEFTHDVKVLGDGCTVSSTVTATNGNHSGEHVLWEFWDINQVVWTNTQTFTARNGEPLTETFAYPRDDLYADSADDYFVEVSVWKTRKDGTLVSVWRGGGVSGSLSTCR